MCSCVHPAANAASIRLKLSVVEGKVVWVESPLRRWLWVVPAWAICFALTGASAEAAHDIALRSNSVGAENHVLNVVRVRSFPGGRCGATVRTRRYRPRSLPGVRLTRSGAMKWTWEPSKGVPAGRWYAK